MVRIEWDRTAIRALEEDPALVELLADVGMDIRDAARANVEGHYPGTDRGKGIAVVDGVDSVGPYVDVGYTTRDPGFVLFFSEVGTVEMSPRPHLRVALTQVHL